MIFKLNSEDEYAHQYLYIDIPKHYTWNYSNHTWEPRKQREDKVVVRMNTVSLNDPERFAVRLLLSHRKGCKSYEDLRTINGTTYSTFMETCKVLKLLDDQNIWDDTMREASMTKMPDQLRQLFVIIITQNEGVDTIMLWNNHKQKLSEDFFINLISNQRTETISLEKKHQMAEQKAYVEINKMMEALNVSLTTHNLILPTEEGIEYDNIFQMMEEEMESVSELIQTLNEKQRLAFDEIMSGINKPDGQKLFFIDGPGGSGKTYLYNVLMKQFEQMGKKVLPLAFTGIASTLLKNGRTIHSTFKFELQSDKFTQCHIDPYSSDSDIFREIDVIIIDEISMVNKYLFEAINSFMQTCNRNEFLFGGKTVIVGGDFRQTLPILSMNSSSCEIVSCCANKSLLWNNFTSFTLTANMRSSNQTKFNDWLLQIGNGSIGEPLNEKDDDFKTVPLKFGKHSTDLVKDVFGDNINKLTKEELGSRVILMTTNAQSRLLNNEISEKLNGEFREYPSVDKCDNKNDSEIFTTEFLNKLEVPSLPPHILKLKVGQIVMLMRNINTSIGLCNGTRLIIKELKNNFIVCEKLNESDQYLIPKCTLSPTDQDVPLKMKRLQFPLITSFCMTINKSQGQSFGRVGVDLSNNPFSHGQLYVALSRIKDHTKLFFSTDKKKENMFVTTNVVYQQVFQQ